MGLTIPEGWKLVPVYPTMAQMDAICTAGDKAVRIYQAAINAAPIAPECATCNDRGMIGGPSYYAPDEGGEPCLDCVTAGPVNWQHRCEALVDIYDDAMNNAPEDRSYVDGAFKAEIDEVRQLLADSNAS